MNKTKLISLLLKLQKQTNVGISLTELLVALVMGGIVLTAAASGFVNLLRANQDVESKTVRNTGLARALSFIQEDVKQGISVTREALASGACLSPDVDSAHCLKITSADGTVIYYGFKDISTGTQEFLKPGVLKRKSGTTAWEVVADGLINTTIPTTTCSGTTVGLTTGTVAVHGTKATNLGGFGFCLNNDTIPTAPALSPNRLVRLLLYGYVGKNVTPQSVDIVTFARGESRFTVTANSKTSSNATVTLAWAPLSSTTYTVTRCLTSNNNTTLATSCSPSGTSIRTTPGDDTGVNLTGNTSPVTISGVTYGIGTMGNNACYTLTSSGGSVQTKCVK